MDFHGTYATFLMFFFLFQGVHLWNTLHTRRPKQPSMPCTAARQCRWVALWHGQVRIRQAFCCPVGWWDNLSVLCSPSSRKDGSQLRHAGPWVCLTHQWKGQDDTVIAPRCRAPRGPVFCHQQLRWLEKKEIYSSQEPKTLGQTHHESNLSSFRDIKQAEICV